jgi:hypothetical protein
MKEIARRRIPVASFLKEIPRISWETESVFVNVSGAQESILPGWESIAGFLKRFTNAGSGRGGGYVIFKDDVNGFPPPRIFAS